MAYPIRYVVTIIGKDGIRTLFDHMQGQYTYATPEEAQARCDVFRANSPSTIDGIYGPNAHQTMAVRPCECYPGHFDPVGCYFDVPEVD